QHAVALAYRIRMNFHRIGAVFEIVFLADGLPGQLALLADGHETEFELMGDGAAENEATRLDARDEIELRALVKIDQRVNRLPETSRVTQQGRDVAEQDSGLR